MAEVLALNPSFELLPAREKKFAELAVLVHHYGGHRHSFKRHAEWLNELGFDVATFDLPFKKFGDLRSGLPFDKEWRLGMRHVWADKVENVLGQLNRDKFIFSFSLPSAAVGAALARRHAIDVKGWVCEGGPFLQLPRAGRNLLRHELLKHEPGFINNGFVREALSRLSGFALGAHRYENEARENLLALPKGFPVLSLSGGRDVLVSRVMIDEFFAPAFRQIDFERVQFWKAQHLTAFRDEPEAYKKVVGAFLSHRATRL